MSEAFDKLSKVLMKLKDELSKEEIKILKDDKVSCVDIFRDIILDVV